MDFLLKWISGDPGFIFFKKLKEKIRKQIMEIKEFVLKKDDVYDY